MWIRLRVSWFHFFDLLNLLLFGELLLGRGVLPLQLLELMLLLLLPQFLLVGEERAHVATTSSSFSHLIILINFEY